MDNDIRKKLLIEYLNAMKNVIEFDNRFNEFLGELCRFNKDNYVNVYNEKLADGYINCIKEIFSEYGTDFLEMVDSYLIDNKFDKSIDTSEFVDLLWKEFNMDGIQ